MRVGSMFRGAGATSSALCRLSLRGAVAAARTSLPAAVLLLLLAACASGGSVRSGLSAEYAPGLKVTLISWKDGLAEYAGTAAQGRWLSADVKVDYDGNAQFAEVPTFALRIRWEGPDGSRSESSPLWVYDPTPGAGGAAKREALRVRISNRFTLAYDLPAEAVPLSFAIGGEDVPLSPPSP